MLQRSGNRVASLIALLVIAVGLISVDGFFRGSFFHSKSQLSFYSSKLYASTISSSSSALVPLKEDNSSKYLPFPGLEDILMKVNVDKSSRQSNRLVEFYYPSFTLAPSQTVNTPPSKRGKKQKQQDTEEEKENQMLWQLHLHRKEVQSSIQRNLEQVQKYLKQRPSDPDFDIGDGLSQSQEQLNTNFEKYQRLLAIDKAEILQTVSLFYQDLFEKKSTSSVWQRDPSRYWLQSNQTVFKPVKEVNLYHGYDNIVKYYQKNLPISFPQNKIQVKDLFLHFMGDVAIVTNQFEVKSVSESVTPPTPTITNIKTLNAQFEKKKFITRTIPHYSTTILVKSQNDQRYYIHSHVTEGYQNLLPKYYNSLRQTYWEPPTGRTGTLLPFTEPSAKDRKLLDRNFNYVGDEEPEDYDDDEEEFEVEDDDYRDSDDDDDDDESDSEIEEISDKDDDSWKKLFGDMKDKGLKAGLNPLNNNLDKASKNFQTVPFSKIFFDPKFKERLREYMLKNPNKPVRVMISPFDVAREMSKMSAEKKRKSINLMKSMLGEVETKRIMRLVKYYNENKERFNNILNNPLAKIAAGLADASNNNNNNFLKLDDLNKDSNEEKNTGVDESSKKNEDDSEKIGEVVEKGDDGKNEKDDRALMRYLNDDSDVNDDLDDDEDDDDDEEDDELESRRSKPDDLAYLTTSAILYLHEKGRFTVEEKSLLVTHLIDCNNNDEYSKVEVAFSVIIAGVRPEVFSKKAKALITALSSALTISMNAFGKINVEDMNDFEMCCLNDNE